MKTTNEPNRARSTVSVSKKSSDLKQEEISNYSENYSALFEQATDAILITDFKGTLKDVNASLCVMFGYAKKELLQLNVRSLLDQEHLANNPIQFDLLANGKNIFNERIMIHKSGRIVYVETKGNDQ